MRRHVVSTSGSSGIEWGLLSPTPLRLDAKGALARFGSVQAMDSHRLPPEVPSSARATGRATTESAPLDAQWLEREAARYLAQGETSERRVAETLERRLRRRCERSGEDPEGILDAIPSVIRQLVTRGYVDDRRYAEQLMGRLQRQGRSWARIRAQLSAKGVAADLVDEIERDRNAESDGPGEEIEAAWLTARKRKLGPYSPDPALREQQRERHLGVLARQGFSEEVATAVIDAAEGRDDTGAGR